MEYQTQKVLTPKYYKCAKCNTTHSVVPNINDAHPSCKKCGGTTFISSNKGIPGYMPVYCDQDKDQRIWNGVMSVVLSPVLHWKTRMEKKHNIEFSKSDVQDLAISITTVSKLILNYTREAFVKDKFVRALHGQFKSFLYSKDKKK